MNNIARMTSSFAIALCGATLFCGLQSTALGAEDSLPTQVVRYSDLNIANPAGAKVLLRRIEAAAHRVCQLGMVSNKHYSQAEQTCFRNAVEGAVKSVNSETLTGLYSPKTLRLAGM
jgi:UrcA family protein